MTIVSPKISKLGLLILNSIITNIAISLIICLVLTVSYPEFVHAVTDAELEAIEKQKRFVLI